MYTSPMDYHYYKLPAAVQPEAYITVNRNRVKVYPNNYIYLQDKQEFEVELFNPTQNTVLAKISLNGKLISTGGIVIKPGRRVYLERFLDSAKKFLFETYDVESTETAMQAIANNGDVRIGFYNEYTPVTTSYNTLSLNSYSSAGHAYFSNSGNLSNSKRYFRSTPNITLACTDSVETGRIEQGANSNQQLINYQGEFNSYANNSVYFKILPVNNKPVEAKDLAIYCTNCGTKNKKNSYKFCPACGNKFE